MKNFYFGASVPILDNGATISNAHMENDQGEDNGWSEDAGAWIYLREVGTSHSDGQMKHNLPPYLASSSLVERSSCLT